MNRLLLILSIMFLVGCSAKVETEYVEVLIPVKAPIDKPSRPEYLPTDSVVTYLPKVLNYSRLLEHIIDTHNGSIDVTND